MGRYVKYNKDEGARLKGELNSAFEELKTTLNDIETYCVNRRSVPRDKIYSDHSVWNAIGEFFERVVDWDWTDDYEQFKKILDAIKVENTNTKNGELNSELSFLKKAMEGLDQLINEFDVATAFNLEESYESENNVTIKGGSDGSSVIYYIDADGKEISLASLTNAFYTETGMTMDAMLKASLTAEENGVEFDAKYQQNVYDAVGATVGDIKDVGGFGVASEQDIIAVDEYLKEDINYKSYLAYDAEGKLARDTGATNANNMAVGSDALNAYAIQDYINGEQFGGDKTVPTGGETEAPSYPQGDAGGVYDDGGSTPGGPTERPYTGSDDTTTDDGTTDDSTTDDTTTDDTTTDDTTTEDTIPEDNTVGGTGLTVEEVDNMSKEIETIAGDEDYKNVEIDTTDDYDAMARDKYETMDQEELAERRGNIISEAEELFANEDKTALRNKLKEYGYDERDIDKIVQSEDATISAMMEGDQRMTMSEYAKEFAEKDGVKDFDSKYDDEQDYRNYNEDSSSHIIANRNNDPVVQEKREDYVKSKEEYEKAADDVNTSINNVNDSKDEIEKFKEEHGSDVSKWTKENVKDYKEKVDTYNDNVKDMNDKKDVLEEKEKIYQEDKAEYDKAKDNFDKRIRGENVDDSNDLNEREKEQSAVDVTVEDDELLPGSDSNTRDGDMAETPMEEIKTYGKSSEAPELGPKDGTGAPQELHEVSKEAVPELGPKDGTGAPQEILEVNKEEPPMLNEGESLETVEIKNYGDETTPFVDSEGNIQTVEPPIVKEDGTVGMEITNYGETKDVTMNQDDLLGMATETVDASQLATAEPVTASSDSAEAAPTFSAEANVEPSFNAVKENVQNAAKSLEGETAQDIEKEIIDNLVVNDDSLTFAKPINEAVDADSVTDVGNGQTEVSVGEAALLSQITQDETESKKEE